MRDFRARRAGSAFALIASLALVLPGAALEAQEEFPSEPPPPDEPADVQFPEVGRDTLDNGLELVVVENHEQPVVSVRLYVPGGEVADPRGLAGTASLVSRMIDKGTDSRSAEEIASTVEGAGASLSAGASDDYGFVATTALTKRLPTVMEVFADVVRNPTFPEEKLATEKKRFASSLEQQLSNPGQLASRRFREVVYGEHPYGEAPTPGTADEIGRKELVSFHDDRYVPEGALLVFAGDIDLASARESARRWFGDWSGSAPSTVDFPAPPEREERAVHLVHRPGSVQSSVRVGHLGLAPGASDRYAVDVMNRVLGGGANARLFLILREEKGWTYGAYSSFTDARGRGHFVARAEVRNPVTDSAVNEILDQMERIRTEPVSDEELSDAKSYLTGNFPLQIETPQQVASRVSDVLLRGLDIDYLETYRSRISEVGKEQIRRAAREHLHPDRAAVVVVGDATRVRDQLEGVGPITMVDTDFEPLAMADLEIERTEVALDASRMRRGSFQYTVSFRGREVASSMISVEEIEGGSVRITEEISGMMGGQTTVYEVSSSVDPISVKQTGQAGRDSAVTELDYADGRVRGTAAVPEGGGQGQRPQIEQVQVDTTIAEGTVDQSMMPAVLLSSPLAEDFELQLPVFSPRGGVTQLSARVVGSRTVQVPAGEFEAWKLEVEQGGQTLNLFVTKETPHLLVRQAFSGRPITLELQSVGGRDDGSGQDGGGGSGGADGGGG